MSLQETIEDLSNVDENDKKWYVESDNGYSLIPNALQIRDEMQTVLKSASAARQDYRTLKAKHKQYEGVNLEEYKSNMAAFQELQDKVESGSLENEDAFKLKLDQKERAWQREKDLYDTKISEYESANKRMLKEKIDTTRDSKIVSITNGKINPFALKDIQLRAERELIYNEDEKQFFTEDGLTVDEWFNDRKQKSAWLPLSYGAGAEGSGEYEGEENPYSKATWNATKQGLLERDNPAKAEKMKKSAKK